MTIGGLQDDLNRLVYQPVRFRIGEAWSGLVVCATFGIIVSLALGSPWGYATALVAAVAAVVVIHRASRIGLFVDTQGVAISNYWTEHHLSWEDIRGVGIAVKGVLPQPAFAFNLRSGRVVFAQATPPRQSDRNELREAMLALGPADVEALPDIAAKYGIGSDRALTARLRLWWRSRFG
jgi:hypothetical protein